MAYRRIYDDSAASPSLAQCSLPAHLAFAHLTYVADSWGRGNDNPRWILSRMFEIRRDVTEIMVAEWMDEWEAAGLIVRYEVGGRHLFQIIQFDKWQGDTVRNRRKMKSSKYPPCPSLPDISPDVPHDFPTSTPPVSGNAADQNTEDRTQKTEQQKTECQNAGTAVAVQPSSRPRIGDVPREVLDDAEQYLGRPLGEGDCQFLVQFVLVDQYDVAWLPLAYKKALLREKPIRSLAWVAKVLAGWRAEGGPEQSAAPRSQDPPTQVDEGPVPPIVDELIALGVGSKAARKLAAEKSEQAIRDQIAWLPKRGELDNPTAFLISAIRDGMAPPPEVVAQRRAEEQRAAEAKRMEERRRKADAEEQRAKAIAEYRAGLSEDEQADLRAAAEAKVDAFKIAIEPRMRKTLVESAAREIVAERLGLPAVEGGAS